MSNTDKKNIRKDIKELSNNINSVVITNNWNTLQIQYSWVEKEKYNKFKEDIMLKLANKDLLKYFTKVEFIDVTF